MPPVIIGAALAAGLGAAMGVTIAGSLLFGALVVFAANLALGEVGNLPKKPIAS